MVTLGLAAEGEVTLGLGCAGRGQHGIDAGDAQSESQWKRDRRRGLSWERQREHCPPCLSLLAVLPVPLLGRRLQGTRELTSFKTSHLPAPPPGVTHPAVEEPSPLLSCCSPRT